MTGFFLNTQEFPKYHHACQSGDETESGVESDVGKRFHKKAVLQHQNRLEGESGKGGKRPEKSGDEEGFLGGGDGLFEVEEQKADEEASQHVDAQGSPGESGSSEALDTGGEEKTADGSEEPSGTHGQDHRGAHQASPLNLLCL